MATASRKTSKTPAKRATSAVARQAPASRAARAPKTPAAQEATALLKADHRRVSDLFDQYEKTRSPAKKKALVGNICMELGIHAKAEEEIFYPAVKAALKDKELVPEATVEHATMKELMAQVEGKEPDGEMFDAKIKVLSEYVKHHVKEEETEMFPKARKTKLDMKALGAQIAARKDELKATWPLPEDKPGILSRVVDAIA
jgi:hemerythrin superfamily protein